MRAAQGCHGCGMVPVVVVQGVRWWRGAAVIAGAALVCAGATASQAVVSAGAASPHVLYVKPGDAFVVKGTTLTCQVFNSKPVAVQCINSSTPKALKPAFGSYGIGVDAAVAAIFRVEPRSAPIEVRYHQPNVSGAVFATPNRKHAIKWTVTPPTAILVGSTHIFCAADVASGAGLNVTCGLSTLANHLSYPAGTYVTSFSDKFVLLGQAKGNGGLKTLAFKKQPKL